MGRIAWVLIIVACSSSAPPPPVPVGPPPPPPPPNPSSCPASFSTASGECTPDPASARCHYDEGSCYCGVTPVCSGAVRPRDEERQDPTYWQCSAKPPLVRPDGCPGSEPSGSCTQNGKRCTYGSCCVTHFECRSGTWQNAGGECPP